MTPTFQVSSGVVNTWRHLKYDPWYALSEFIDNSTSEFFFADGRKAVDEPTIRVVRDDAQDILLISDNASGISPEIIEARILQAGIPPESQNGRSKYGMGMKCAAVWFADRMTLRTSRFGEPVESVLEIDWKRVADGGVSLQVHDRPDLKDSHYTEITLSNLHRPIRGATWGKVKRHLAEMYRRDMTNRGLRIQLDEEVLSPFDLSALLMLSADGATPFKTHFSETLEVDGQSREVTGWVGVLDKGSRNLAGFTRFTRDRVIDMWYPEAIFHGRSNDLVNQRLVGEINFDGFIDDVSHTKDVIQLSDTWEQVLGEYLESITQEYVRVAKERRKRGTKPEITEAEIKHSIETVQRDLTEGEGASEVLLDPIPDEEIAERTVQPLLAASEDTDRAEFVAVVGKYEVRIFVPRDLSPNDPYCYADSPNETLIDIIVNVHHPFVSTVDDLTLYFRLCVYDALTNVKARRESGEFSISQIEIIRDRLLRNSVEISESTK